MRNSSQVVIHLVISRQERKMRLKMSKSTPLSPLQGFSPQCAMSRFQDEQNLFYCLHARMQDGRVLSLNSAGMVVKYECDVYFWRNKFIWKCQKPVAYYMLCITACAKCMAICSALFNCWHIRKLSCIEYTKSHTRTRKLKNSRWKVIFSSN